MLPVWQIQDSYQRNSDSTNDSVANASNVPTSAATSIMNLFIFIHIHHDTIFEQVHQNNTIDVK